jgi:hypothetical protein
VDGRRGGAGGIAGFHWLRLLVVMLFGHSGDRAAVAGRAVAAVGQVGRGGG